MKKFWFPALWALFAWPLLAQDTLEVVKTSGPSEIFLTSAISKITFTATDMVVAGPNRNIPISTIAVILFHANPLTVEVETPGAEGRVGQPSPNPFNPATTLRFTLVRDGRLSARVFDARGKAVRALFSGHKRAGAHSLAWDGRDNAGAAAASGVYHIQLNIDNRTVVKRAVLVR